MKKAILITLSLFIFIAGKAQDDFAPLGAVWYHNFHRGVYKTEAIMDTTVLGISCRKLKQTAFIQKADWYGPREQASRSLLIYSTADTVFLYNELYDQFTPLYVFNVKAGDTVKLPLIRPANSCEKIDTSETQFAFVIDSVKNVVYDGVELKTVYSTAIDTASAYLDWNWGSSKNNIYCEKLGSLPFGLLPDCNKMCPTILPEGCNRSKDLRCYSDSKISIKLYDTCFSENLIPAGIAQTELAQSSLNIVPNPSDKIISIVDHSLNYDAEILLYDALGRKQLSSKIKSGNAVNADVSALAGGIYCVFLRNISRQTFISGKFLKK